MGVDPRSDDHDEKEPSSSPVFYPYLGCKGQFISTPLLLLLIILLLLGIAWFSGPLLEPIASTSEVIGQLRPGQINLSSQFIQHQNALYYIDKEAGRETTDIFMKIITNTSAITPQNVTNSPEYWELHPVTAPKDERVAFFAVSRNGDRSLRLLQPGVGIIDLSYHSGNSGLEDNCQIGLDVSPRWDPDGDWLAFLAECENGSLKTDKLFIVRANGSAMKELIQSDNQITRIEWQGRQTLIYSEQGQDGFEEIYQISTTASQTQPIRLTN